MENLMSLNNVEKFREKISKGQFCVGGCVSFSDPAISEMYGDLGYDFTWIDTEHCPLCLENVLGHIMAGRASGAAPFVRVPANDPILIKPLMDLQPAGIIIPMVNSAEEAKRAVAACWITFDRILCLMKHSSMNELVRRDASWCRHCVVKRATADAHFQSISRSCGGDYVPCQVQ